MEDHLTNKARLDTEWAALCAYDADPCSVAIAQQVCEFLKIFAIEMKHISILFISIYSRKIFVKIDTLTRYHTTMPE